MKNFHFAFKNHFSHLFIMVNLDVMYFEMVFRSGEFLRWPPSALQFRGINFNVGVGDRFGMDFKFKLLSCFPNQAG